MRVRTSGIAGVRAHGAGVMLKRLGGEATWRRKTWRWSGVVLEKVSPAEAGLETKASFECSEPRRNLLKSAQENC
jgi:hypothetical protein